MDDQIQHLPLPEAAEAANDTFDVIDGIELIRGFRAIESPALRKAIVTMVREISLDQRRHG